MSSAEGLLQAPFKILLVGDAGVGKTTLVHFLTTGQYEMRYRPTTGVDVTPGFTFTTTEGPVVFDVWDIAGHERLNPCLASHFVGAAAAILMFDLTSRMTYANIPAWHRAIVQHCGPIPIVLVGNKCDLADRKVHAHDVSFHHGKPMTYYEISVKKPYGVSSIVRALMEPLLGFTSPSSLEVRRTVVRGTCEVDMGPSIPIVCRRAPLPPH